jgi:tRNA threonylcarbamoyladenosine biosynthesis protein TsaB
LNLLAFDTSTEHLSVALSWSDGAGPRLLAHRGEGGRESSSKLIPAAMALVREAGLTLASLDAIVFGCGPGSFTGLRTACAVAQGLAFGADRPVLAVETLLAVAEEARHARGATRVLALLDARMDEVYGAAYLHDGQAWQRQGPITLGRPQAVVLPPGYVMAGNAFAAHGACLPVGVCLEALPTATALLRIAPGLIVSGATVPAHEALPLYVRDKVAQTTEERLALRAAAPAADPAPAAP